MADEPVPWLALGIELRLTTTEEGGRTKTLGVDDDYRNLQYRPNWGLPGMTGTDQVGAPVLCFGNFPLALGDRTRAVIIPLVDLSLDLWRAVQVGDACACSRVPACAAKHASSGSRARPGPSPTAMRLVSAPGPTAVDRRGRDWRAACCAAVGHVSGATSRSIPAPDDADTLGQLVTQVIGCCVGIRRRSLRHPDRDLLGCLGCPSSDGSLQLVEHREITGQEVGPGLP